MIAYLYVIDMGEVQGKQGKDESEYLPPQALSAIGIAGK
jgi:hypothetical protein